MRKDAGLNGDLDRIPQLSWLLFLKAFDDQEEKRRLTNPKYRGAIKAPYRWQDWAADHINGRTGDALLKFVNDDLFPHLRSLRGRGEGDLRDVLAAVFKETHNRMLSGYLLRDVVNVVNGVNFASSDDIHTMAHLYESMLREMRDAAGDSGEFYTPRPAIRFIVSQVGLRLGDVVLDPAAGTCGFLVEALEHFRPEVKTAQQWGRLQKNLRGIEKKPMPYLLGMMNLVLHDVEQPALVRGNALSVPLTQLGKSSQVDVIITNPPFGGEEEDAIQKNFPTALRTSETALLFLQMVMRRLKPGGRCGIVVPDGLLAGTGAAIKIKKQLLREFDLHTIVRLAPGAFAPYTGIPTNLMFLSRTGPTKAIWYYQISPPDDRKNYTKTNPLRYEEFADCATWWPKRVENDQAWRVPIASLDDTVNLDIRNPRLAPERTDISPQDVASQVAAHAEQLGANLLQLADNTEVKSMLNSAGSTAWPRKKLGDGLVTQVEDEVAVDPGTTYKLLGIRLAGEGPFIREEKVGLEMGAKTVNRVHEGNFIYSRLFAWRGAFGMISPELDGCFVSGEFPTFEVNQDEVLTEYLRIYFSRPLVWSEVERHCRGTTKASRNRFKVNFFLDMSIPLVPLELQRQLIEVDHEIRRLKLASSHLTGEVQGMVPALLGSFFQGEL